MAISRMQNPRQLYGLGSFVKSITKPVKKVVSGAVDAVKDVAGSDLGKAALTAAALYYGRGMLQGKGGGLGDFFGRGSFNPFKQIVANIPGMEQYGTSVLSSPFANLLKSPTGIATAIAGTSAVAGLLTPEAEADVEQLKESGDRGLLRKYLDRYYRNLNPIGDKEPEAYEAEVASFVRTNEAEGGRIGYAGGTQGYTFEQFMNDKFKVDQFMGEEQMKKLYEKMMREKKIKEQKQMAAEGGRIGYARGTDELPNDPTEPVNPFKPKPIKPLGSDKMASKEGFTMEDSFKEEDRKVKEALEAYKRYRASGGKKSFRDFIRMIGTGNFADGGRIGFAYGPDSSQMNAVKAAGIEGLPLNKNPAGITELDLRETGGFIPPVGVQEKADDIPAMLSNNEFVFTADAVRGMGGGDVNKGAQRLYDQMKMLEEGGRV